MKPVRVYCVSNAARGASEWVPTLAVARRLANGLYADAATKAPGSIACYLVGTDMRLTRSVAVSLLRGDGTFLKYVGEVDPKPTWWRAGQ